MRKRRRRARPRPRGPQTGLLLLLRGAAAGSCRHPWSRKSMRACRQTAGRLPRRRRQAAWRALLRWWQAHAAGHRRQRMGRCPQLLAPSRRLLQCRRLRPRLPHHYLPPIGPSLCSRRALSIARCPALPRLLRRSWSLRSPSPSRPRSPTRMRRRTSTTRPLRRPWQTRGAWRHHPQPPPSSSSSSPSSSLSSSPNSSCSATGRGPCELWPQWAADPGTRARQTHNTLAAATAPPLVTTVRSQRAAAAAAARPPPRCPPSWRRRGRVSSHAASSSTGATSRTSGESARAPSGSCAARAGSARTWL